MKKHFIVYASKNRPSAKISIQASHLSDKYEEPAYGFKDLPHELDGQSDAFANTSLDILHKLWISMSDSDQFAAEYAMGFMNSDGYTIENVSDDDLESYARRGCNQINEGNAEPEYADEDFYMDEADFDTVFNYLKAKRDDRLSITGSCDIKASEGYRDDNDWLLKPGNQWYAVAEYWESGDAESGPMVSSNWSLYQAASEDEAIELAKRESHGRVGIGDARPATQDEIEEFYYEVSQGVPAPDEDYSESDYSYGGIIDEEDIL